MIKQNLDITIIPAFLTKRSEFGRLKFQIYIEVWFWLYGITNATAPNTIQIENSKQEAINRELKTKTYKKASLNTNLTNFYATKLILRSK